MRQVLTTGAWTSRAGWLPLLFSSSGAGCRSWAGARGGRSRRLEGRPAKVCPWWQAQEDPGDISNHYQLLKITIANAYCLSSYRA